MKPFESDMVGDGYSESIQEEEETTHENAEESAEVRITNRNGDGSSARVIDDHNINHDETNATRMDLLGLTIDMTTATNTLVSQRSQEPSSTRTATTARTTHPASSARLDAKKSSSSRPPSHDASARSQSITSRVDFALDDAAEEAATPGRDASAFRTWTATPAVQSGGSTGAYRIGPFVLLLLDEFCRHYGLTATASTLLRELQDVGVEIPGADLWIHMYSRCSEILRNKKHTHPLAAATTLERLVEFCVTPRTRKAVLSVEMLAAHSPMHVCASPKRVPSTHSLKPSYQQMRSPIVRPSQRPSNNPAENGTPMVPPPPEPIDEELDEPEDLAGGSPLRSPESPTRKSFALALSKKTKKNKPRQHRSLSVLSVVSPSSHLHGAQVPPKPHVMPGTFGEPALVETHMTELKRDRTSTWLLEKELRHLRLEKILTNPTILTQKKLGFYTLSADETRMRQQLHDPYANELVLEKYGFAKRQDCALCQQPYLLFNLPHRVSFKCIMEVYDHWQYVPPDRATAAKYRTPLCYDAVHVCRMCAQIVFQFATQPEAKPARPLSRKQKLAKSLATLQLTTPNEDASFCSDPYALPPLLSDDVYDHRDAVEPSIHVRRRGFRTDGDPSDGDGRAMGVGESPAKAIVYSQQGNGAPFMTAKEWNVINPDKSSTRHRMEASLAAATVPLVLTQGPRL